MKLLSDTSTVIRPVSPIVSRRIKNTRAEKSTAIRNERLRIIFVPPPYSLNRASLQYQSRDYLCIFLAAG